MTPKLNDAELHELLQAPEIGVLCTVDSKGRPEGSPIWFEARDGKIYVHVDAASRKARNIRSNPNVSLTVDTRVAPYKGAVLRGVVRELPPDPEILRRTAVHYLGQELGENYLAVTSAAGAASTLLEMTVTSCFTWDYSKGF